MKFAERAQNHREAENVNPELHIDNPMLNFLNSDAFQEKQKSVLKEKIKQTYSSIDHYIHLGHELKLKKLEVIENITNEAINALSYPLHIKSFY